MSLFYDLSDKNLEENFILKCNRSLSITDKHPSLEEIGDFVEDKNFVKRKLHEKIVRELKNSIKKLIPETDLKKKLDSDKEVGD